MYDDNISTPAMRFSVYNSVCVPLCGCASLRIYHKLFIRPYSWMRGPILFFGVIINFRRVSFSFEAESEKKCGRWIQPRGERTGRGRRGRTTLKRKNFQFSSFTKVLPLRHPSNGRISFFRPLLRRRGRGVRFSQHVDEEMNWCQHFSCSTIFTGYLR